MMGANYHLILLSRLCFRVAPRISNLALKRKKLILEKITSLVAGCIQQWHFWRGNQLFTVQSIANNPHIPMAIGERLSWKFCNLDESCSQFILSGFELWAWESWIWFQNIKPGKDVLVITQGIMPTLYSDEGSLNISNAKNIDTSVLHMLHMLHVLHIFGQVLCMWLAFMQSCGTLPIKPLQSKVLDRFFFLYLESFQILHPASLLWWRMSEAHPISFWRVLSAWLSVTILEMSIVHQTKANI